MIDTHAHLDFPQFDGDRDETIKRFLASGGRWLLNIGVNTERNQKSLQLAEKYEQIYCTLGYHPEELAEKSLDELLPEVEDFLLKKGKNKKVRAIGEIGLDYFHNPKNKDDQKKLFIKQLEIASKLNLPVILHCRESYEDVFDLISNFEFRILNQISISSAQIKMEEGDDNMLEIAENAELQVPRFVLHCYSGNLEQTEKFLQLPSVYFSFTGNITFPKKSEAEIFQVVRKIPENRIMAETDCPFLAPHPYRGKRNEPSYVRLVLEKMAEIRKISFEEMEKITDKNAKQFFNLEK